MRWLCAGLLFAAVSVSAPALGQTPSPIVEHYLAYVAARDQGDMETAESEAEQALAASEARDGDGGRTAVLALNLATTRLDRGDSANAAAPALRALTLAQAGAVGVDPAYAALILGRAELAAQGQPGADRLRALFNDGALGALSAEAIYATASSLGTWALENHDFETARYAWAMAADHASGSMFGETFGLAQAQTFEASAIFFAEIGQRGRSRMDATEAREAYRMLSEAAAALTPLANVDAPTLELTVAQQALADALAVRGALRAKMRSDGQRVLEDEEAQGDADGFAELSGPVDITVPRCLVTLQHRPTPQFPSDALRRGHLAGVVLRLRLNAEGGIAESGVVSRIGDESFTEAVERVAPLWTVERRSDSPPHCRMESTLLVPVTFYLAEY